MVRYKQQLHFFQRLLKGMNISSCIIDQPGAIPSQVDLGLREELFGVDNYSLFLGNSLSQAESNTIYRFFDEYNCNYIFMRLPETAGDSYFYIGPYLLDAVTEKMVDAKVKALELDPEQKQSMLLYYSDLPIIEDENLLLTAANAFGEELWGEPGSYSMEYVDYMIPDRRKPVPVFAGGRNFSESSLSLSTLEQNYASERQLMEAVSKGKLHLVTAVASTVFNNGTDGSRADSLRQRKNHLIILKTLLRKAAELGGVHPLHIHKLSELFSDRIEGIRSIKQSYALQDEMIRSFCILVKQHSLSKYSYYVGQVITLVQYDLTAELSLKAISEKLNVNPSYLSDLFHREYGCTLTEFINTERVNHGIRLLHNTQKSVQEIAADCGVHDVNYFIKLFKKQTGTTPARYREQL